MHLLQLAAAATTTTPTTTHDDVDNGSARHHDDDGAYSDSDDSPARSPGVHTGDPGTGRHFAAAPAVPAYGQATAWGCAAALAYLPAYAAPGFALDCPGYAEGHEAMTCLHGTPAYPDACPNGPTIAISDPCPQAYMNESANSWNLTGQLSVEQQKFGVSYADIDPFGACP